MALRKGGEEVGGSTARLPGDLQLDWSGSKGGWAGLSKHGPRNKNRDEKGGRELRGRRKRREEERRNEKYEGPRRRRIEAWYDVEVSRFHGTRPSRSTFR
jgi:hypothetical protein